LRATGRPFIELHGHPRFGGAAVSIDAIAHARLAMDHFLDCGLSRFGFFTLGTYWWIEKHRKAFCEELGQRGFECSVYDSPVFDDELPVWNERQRPKLVRWLRSLERPVGILTIGDLHAVHLMDVCQELGIAVPEDIAILGTGNDPVICETVHPTLSSIDLDARRIGYEAARMLDQKMSGKACEEDMPIAPSHVAVRQSTDIVAIHDADVAHAVRYIRRFACKGIAVACVAHEVGLSRSSLEQRFHRYLERTPAAEIMRVRIEHAKLLLSRTDEKCETIARKSGFASAKYFMMAFRREVGATPAVYRRSRRISRDIEDLGHEKRSTK
jgi:LacI family transcriptional regulator